MTPYIEHCQNVPKWMIKKVANIARNLRDQSNVQNAYNQLIYNATLILKLELQIFPDLSLLVPREFLEALVAGTGSNLSNLECAAIIILQYEAENTTPINFKEHLKEYLQLKWESLNSLLERNSDE